MREGLLSDFNNQQLNLIGEKKLSIAFFQTFDLNMYRSLKWHILTYTRTVCFTKTVFVQFNANIV